MHFLFPHHIYKKIIIFFLIITFIAPATSAFCKKKNYQEAKSMLASGHTEEAYDFLWEKIMKEPDNTRLNFLFGKAALKLKLYENAAAAYERILMINPDNAKAQLHLAISYYRLGAYVLAEKEFGSLVKKDVSSNTKNISEKFIAAIHHRKSSHQWNVSFAAGRLYNSNVNTAPSDKKFDTVNGTVSISSNDTEQSDWGTIVAFTAGHKWDFGMKSGFSWKSRMILHNNFYDSKEQYNINLVSLKTGPSYIEHKNFRLSMPLTVDLFEYGNTPYFQGYGFNPRLDLLHNNNFLTRLSATCEHQEYSDDNRSDGTYYYIEAMPRFFWNSKKFMLQWSMGYEWKCAKNNIKTYEGVRTNILFQYKINKWVKHHFTLEYRNSQYKDLDILFNKTRNSDRYKAGMRTYLSLPWQNLRTIISLDYTDCQSNIEIYEYTRTRTIIKLEKRF